MLRACLPQSHLSAELDALFDAAALRGALTQDAGQRLTLVKAAVSRIDEGLEQFYRDGGDASEVVFGRARLIDRLLQTLYEHFFAALDQPLALLAVGGYGRGELHPKSDIDLMLLLEASESDATRERIEQFLMLLWDSRLEIGHSVRTLDECVAEAEKDITVTTNIMEARLLAGDATLFEAMKARTAPDRIWDSKAFFQAKLEEQIQRNGKFNDTAYNLEPNIKESHGGLRDIQMIGWVAKRHFNADSLKALVDEGFLLEDEYQTLCKGQHLLWRIRCSLHYLAGRREDRLLFDFQRQLAHEFGFEEAPGEPANAAIEQFMQQYYRTVMQLEQLNEMLLQHFREAIIYADAEGAPQIINESFQVCHGYLQARGDDTFEKRPDALLQMFVILEEHADIQGVHAQTIRLIRHNLHRIDDAFRQSETARRLFMRIISSPRGVTHELRRMNRYGILAAYIPAFDSIVGRMQYDLFHAYTVDQHTLFVIRNMRRLSVPEFCHEFPLASGIFHHLPKPSLLYLAGLFHDIAKGRKGDHSELGAVDAYRFCIEHSLKEDEARLVSWLVQSHLLMSMTAQRQDISDPDVIADFAQKVGSLSRLDYLYLLTMCDIRATNPKQWNSWKDKLLGELYHKTAALLNRGMAHRKTRMDAIVETQTDALRHLEQQGIHAQQAHAIWKHFNDAYFQNHTAGEIVWHTELLSRREDDATPLVATRADNHSHSIELMVYMPSRDHIFFDIVDLLSNSGIDVVSANIVNCDNGYALETFRLIPVLPDNQPVGEAELQHNAGEIRQRLEQRLQTHRSAENHSPDTRGKHRHFSAPTSIGFREKNGITRMRIETLNRAGLLATIAHAFYLHDIRLLNARVSSAGEKAIDYFFITGKDDRPLTPEQQAKLEQHLRQTL